MRFDYRFAENEPLLRKRLAILAEDYAMEYDLELYDESAPATRRMAVFVSKEDHCLFDLLYRQRKGELRCEIPLVVSNHETLRPVAEQFGVPFAFVPMDRSLPRDERKAVQEAQVVALLEEAQVDVVVLARYMQILTDDFCSKFKTINIHHSFLPAFAGAKPYHQAHQRGVKCRRRHGALRHGGARRRPHHRAGGHADHPSRFHHVSHMRNSREERRTDSPLKQNRTMVRKGREMERVALARAVRYEFENRVCRFKNKTVVFEE